MGERTIRNEYGGARKDVVESDDWTELLVEVPDDGFELGRGSHDPYDVGDDGVQAWREGLGRFLVDSFNENRNGDGDEDEDDEAECFHVCFQLWV